MKTLSLLSFALAVSACTAPTSSNQTGRLSAGPDARHLGVYSYGVTDQTITLFDQNGIEAGQIAVSEPTSDRRVFDIALADGTTDEAEVYRPLDDGRFFAPVTPDTALTAALADPALAPVWGAHRVTFHANISPRLSPVIGTDSVATTTSCTSPTSDSPDGCARPANTAVGCTNPIQLPAAIIYDQTVSDGSYDGVQTRTACTNLCTSVGEKLVTYILVEQYCECGYRETTNSWTASCPRSTCGTVGQYDAVPRLRDCEDPGSCTKSQGSVGCTPYH